ncbi:hypothetical protein ACIA6C_28185 [Streptomyces sp. NPDC051578]|uniref:hypothetical protein n=1 Tax=Streptomyces sp. NPDC051578 TaxID=3365662 RepID=UPI0037892BBD
MALIRKASAGSDSFGHTWAKDGAVVEIADGEQIAALMVIPDGGFSEVTPDGKPEDAPAGEDAQAELSEVDPADEDIEADRPAARKTAARKTAASKPE